MLLIGLITVCIISIVWICTTCEDRRNAIERMERETILFCTSTLATIVFAFVAAMMGLLDDTDEISASEEAIILVCFASFATVVVSIGILLIEIIAWAIRKLICKLILRKHGIREIPSLDSNWNVLTDDSIRETLNSIYDEWYPYLDEDCFGIEIGEKCDMFILSDPEDLEANDG